MKRIILFVLVFCLIISASACAKGDLPKSEDVEATQTESLATFKEPDPDSVIDTQGWGSVPVNQIAVVFEEGVDKDAAQNVIQEIGGSVVGELAIINLYQIETDDKTEAELLATMDAARGMEGVELVFPNTEIYGDDVTGTPCSPLNDPVYQNPGDAEHYRIIGMENAWRIIKGSGVPLSKVKAGVLDEAIYSGNDEFSGNIKVTGDKTDSPAKKDDQIIDAGLSHGNMVTNVIGADAGNGGMVGIASVLENNLEIDVKGLLNEKKSTVATRLNEDDITQGSYVSEWRPITFAYTITTLVYLKKQVDDGATVINCSFSSADFSYKDEWITKAYEKFFRAIHKTKPHVVFVASAGNKGNAKKTKGALNGQNSYPGGLRLPNVITVGAINNDGSRANYSSFATGDAEVTLSAPGTEMVLGVDESGQPIKASGTSFSTPQVTAAVALLQSINPKLDAAQIKELLTSTAAPGITTGDQSIPIPEGMGAGILKVDEAVLRAINDLRGEQNLEPYTVQQLLDTSAVSLSASGGPTDYIVTAGVSTAVNGSADLKIELQGEYTLSEGDTKNIPAGGEGVWNVTIEEGPVFIRVVRLDNGGCAHMTLTKEEAETGPITAQDMTGTYSGSATLQHIEEDIEAPDSLPVTLQLGEAGTGTVDVNGYGGEAQCAGNNVSFSVTTKEDGAVFSFVFKGKASTNGNQTVISGVMNCSMNGVTFASYTLTAQ
jgi:hypothetical protein